MGTMQEVKAYLKKTRNCSISDGNCADNTFNSNYNLSKMSGFS